MKIYKIPKYKGPKQLIKKKQQRCYFIKRDRNQEKRLSKKIYTMPIKALCIKFIDGKLIKRDKNRLRKGNVKGRGLIRFNLMDDFYEKSKSIKKQYDCTLTPMYSVLKNRQNSIQNYQRSFSMPIAASQIRNIDGKMIKKIQYKNIISKSKLVFSQTIEILGLNGNNKLNTKKQYDYQKMPLKSILQFKPKIQKCLKFSLEENKTNEQNNKRKKFINQWLLTKTNSQKTYLLEEFKVLNVKTIFKDGIPKNIFNSMVEFLLLISQALDENDLQIVLEIIRQFERLPSLQKQRKDHNLKTFLNIEEILQIMENRKLLSKQQYQNIRLIFFDQ